MKILRGVNLDPHNPAGAPNGGAVKDFGFAADRYVLRNTEESRRYHAQTRTAGLEALGIVTSETLATYIGPDVPNPLTLEWIEQNEDRVRGAIFLAVRTHPDLVGLSCGNEPDGSEGASWKMGWETYVRFHNLVADVAWADGITVCTAGLSSGQPEWFEQVVDSISFDVLLVHPYAKTPEEARSLLRAYKALVPPGKMIGVSEWHRGEPDQVGAFVQMMEEEGCWGWWWFAWSSGMVPDFGLYDERGRLRERGKLLRDHLAANPPAHAVWTAPAPVPTGTEYERFCRPEARRRGIDPDIAVRVANSEGGLTEPARRGTFDTGSSWWAFQLHYGGPGYEHFGTVAGMGNDFTRVTGWRPGDPAAWRDAMRWALDRAKWSGWGAWYGAAHVGIGRWDGIDRTFPWSGTPEDEWDYKRREPQPQPDEPPHVTYGRAILQAAEPEVGKRYAGPVIGEPDSYRWGNPGWDCSSLVSAAVERASGGRVRLTPFTDAIFRETLPLDPNDSVPGDIILYEYRDPSQPGVRFPHVGILAGPDTMLDAQYPVGVGVHSILNRPYVLRRVPSVAVEPEPEPVPAPTCEQERDGLRVALAYVCDDVGDKLALPRMTKAKRLRMVEEMRRVREQFLGPREVA